MGDMKLGVIITLCEDIEMEFKKVRDLGFRTCQLSCDRIKYFGDAYANRILKACKDYCIEITAFWCGWEGPTCWDFYNGPATIGLVPAAYRASRMDTLVMGSDFAKKLGVTDVATHAGFIPEDPTNPDYNGTVNALKYIAAYLKTNDQFLLLETGQETPITLLRTLRDIGADNLGINFDPANLLMYGKANPLDALNMLGSFVRGVHAKDGEYPTDGKSLGAEKPIGQGIVNFPEFISRLKGIGYSGAITIEREITGEQQINDIKYAKQILEDLI